MNRHQYRYGWRLYNGDAKSFTISDKVINTCITHVVGLLCSLALLHAIYSWR